MTMKQWLLSSFVASTCLISIAAVAGPIENYSPVTADRLQNPEPGNWMLYRRTYDGQGYSPLDQINTSNVKNLTPVWTFSTGVIEGHEAPPIVNNGVMFVATPMGQVIALNAKTGDEYWRYKRQLPDDLFQLHPTSRGVGLWQDKLYLATTDDHIVALDAKTGKVVWDKKVQDYKKGQYMTLMPMVVDGKVVVGGSGGEFGVRGYVVAFDANDGKELWRTFTIPGEGEPGHDTWSGDDWKSGGGPAWMTGTYDKDTKTIYWGIGNAAPWPGATHPGDNLYTSSVLGLDPDTGKIKAFHQYHQNDSWDWDEVDAPMLIDLQRDGRSFKSLIHPGRDAIFWVLERKPDSINYVAGWPFVHTDVWKGIEAETGRPIVDPDAQADASASGLSSARRCGAARIGRPRPTARKPDWSTFPPTRISAAALPARRCRWFPASSGSAPSPKISACRLRPGADHFGELQAWDPATGKKAWSHNFAKSQLFGSVTATAGDLVFAGGTNDRMFRAFDAKTGDVLWEQKTNSGIMGMPIAYEVDGTEYIAIQSGWGVDAQRIQDALAGDNVGIESNVPQGGVVWVFAVKK